MNTTYNSAIEAEAIRILDELIAEQMLLLANGHIEDISKYKFHIGKIRGLETAKEAVADAQHYVQTGERK
jgi:hypothetical protein